MGKMKNKYQIDAKIFYSNGMTSEGTSTILARNISDIESVYWDIQENFTGCEVERLEITSIKLMEE